ncbi:hypothetical protein PSAE105876_29605 [Pseudomonas aeruginosa]
MVGGVAEQDRQAEAAEAADHPDHAADGAHVARVVVVDDPVHAGLAEALGDADDEHQEGEQPDVQADAQAEVALDAVDGHGGLRVGEEEQAHQADPEHAPVHRARAVVVAEPAAEGADQAGRQGEQHGDEGRGLQVQAVFGDVVLRQPQGQGDEAAEDEEVVQAEAPDAQLGERRQLLGQGRPLAGLDGTLEVRRIGPGEQPEQHGGDQHGHRVDLRHHAPAEGDHDHRRHQVGDRRAGVAGAEDAHRGALALLLEPGRGVGDADREGAASQADEQAEHQVVPVLAGEGQAVDRDGHQQHVDEEHDAAAEAVGDQAQRQAHQGAGEDRQGDHQAELGFAQAKLVLDTDADDRKHRPHGEIHREGQGTHTEDGVLFLT